MKNLPTFTLREWDKTGKVFRLVAWCDREQVTRASHPKMTPL